MRRLAIDTSSLACSVALQFDDRCIERHEVKAREHTRLLMPMIRDVLTEAEVELSELDAIVLGNGPGSFIGMRIAASVAQGLAHAAALSVVPVSSLAAIAAEVMDGEDVSMVAVAQDAHMNEVYLGLFSRGEDNLPVLHGGETLYGGGLIDGLRQHDSNTISAAGAGWSRYPQYFAQIEDNIGGRSAVDYPTARYLLRLSESVAPIRPVDVEPAYIRDKVAEKASKR